jgi:hypothetical protein
VIVVDPADPAVMTGAFESMLDLPEGTLDWKFSNQSLGAVDAELFRHVNGLLTDKGVDWSSFYDLVQKGAILLGPYSREGRANDVRAKLPPWAAEIAERDGRRFADGIRASGVHVVGDLESLAAPCPSGETEPIEDVPIQMAACAVAGAVRAGKRLGKRKQGEIRAQSAEISRLKAELAASRGRTLEEHARSVAPDERRSALARAFTTKELASALNRRLLHKGRHDRSDPLE